MFFKIPVRAYLQLMAKLAGLWSTSICENRDCQPLSGRVRQAVEIGVTKCFGDIVTEDRQYGPALLWVITRPEVMANVHEVAPLEGCMVVMLG